MRRRRQKIADTEGVSFFRFQNWRKGGGGRVDGRFWLGPLAAFRKVRLFSGRTPASPGPPSGQLHTCRQSIFRWHVHEAIDTQVQGDALINAIISFQYPSWNVGVDHEPDRGISTRLRLLDQLATDKRRLVGAHLPFPGAGFVERKDRAYRFVPT